MVCLTGVWREIIKVLGMLGVVVNVAILTYTMDWFSEHYDVTNEDKLWYFIYTEHAILIVYLIIMAFIGDEPSQLQRKMALDMFEAENYDDAEVSDDEEEGVPAPRLPMPDQVDEQGSNLGVVHQGFFPKESTLPNNHYDDMAEEQL